MLVGMIKVMKPLCSGTLRPPLHPWHLWVFISYVIYMCLVWLTVNAENGWFYGKWGIWWQLDNGARLGESDVPHAIKTTNRQRGRLLLLQVGRPGRSRLVFGLGVFQCIDTNIIQKGFCVYVRSSVPCNIKHQINKLKASFITKSWKNEKWKPVCE